MYLILLPLIYIIDDEEDIINLITLHLERSNFQVEGFTDATSFYQTLNKKIPDLIILDLMLPDESGFEICKYLKKEDSYTDIPIIILSALIGETEKILGLELGADDYITKPFSVREVIARVKSVLRRTSTNSNEKISVEYEKLKVDLIRKRCILDGEKVSLTKKEMEILILFLKNRGVVFSREDILHRIWKDDVVVLDRTIDVNITRLRKKIGEYGSHIVTRLGYGYGFEE